MFSSNSVKKVVFFLVKKTHKKPLAALKTYTKRGNKSITSRASLNLCFISCFQYKAIKTFFKAYTIHDKESPLKMFSIYQKTRSFHFHEFTITLNH